MVGGKYVDCEAEGLDLEADQRKPEESLWQILNTRQLNKEDAVLLLCY